MLDELFHVLDPALFCRRQVVVVISIMYEEVFVVRRYLIVDMLSLVEGASSVPTSVYKSYRHAINVPHWHKWSDSLTLCVLFQRLWLLETLLKEDLTVV